MAIGVGDVVELKMVFTAIDAVTNVVQGIGGVLQTAIGNAAGFQTTLTQVQNNTTMTAADVATMQGAVLKLNSQTGAPLDDLTAGFMHITNEGFNAADAVKILTAANESAISTGSRTADVANILGLEMHGFGKNAEEAGRVMNVLHLAAAEGNATLEQFVSGTSRSAAMAANLHIPLTQVNAALAALSRHETLADANTQIVGLFSKLVNPAVNATKELEHLHQVTGIDLPKDFTQAGLQAKGLPAVLDDLKRATGGNVSEMFRLVPALRGGMAEMVLLGTGSQDYKNILADLNDAMAGRTDPTMQAFTRTMNTFNQQMAVLRSNWDQFMMAIGQPIIDTLSPYLHQFVDWMNTHKGDITAFGTALGHDIAAGVKDIPALLTTTKQVLGDVVTAWGTLSTGIGNAFTIARGVLATGEGLLLGDTKAGNKAIEDSYRTAGPILVGLQKTAMDLGVRVVDEGMPRLLNLFLVDMPLGIEEGFLRGLKVAQQGFANLTNLFGTFLSTTIPNLLEDMDGIGKVLGNKIADMVNAVTAKIAEWSHGAISLPNMPVLTGDQISKIMARDDKQVRSFFAGAPQIDASKVGMSEHDIKAELALMRVSLVSNAKVVSDALGARSTKDDLASVQSWYDKQLAAAGFGPKPTPPEGPPPPLHGARRCASPLRCGARTTRLRLRFGDRRSGRHGPGR